MSAGKNIAIGCGVIVLAMVLAGWMGMRWVKNNLGVTMNDSELLAWSEEIIGTTPGEDFDPKFGMFASENKREAFLIFVKPVSRGSEVSLTLIVREGEHDFESVFRDVDAGDDGFYIKFQRTVGEADSYFANWGEVQVPVQLQEGYDDDSGEVLVRQVIGLVPMGDHTVGLFFEGDPEQVDRDAVQELIDRIPSDWVPAQLPEITESE